jgi:hypothetical protein
VTRERVDDAHPLNETLSRIIDLLNKSHVELKSVETNDANLERLFLQLTGSRLRD